MYEVEIKIELTAQEKAALIALFQKKGFASKGVTPQHDVYIEWKESPFGGNNIKRYRNEDGAFIFTQKIWEMAGNTPVRREDEHEVSADEFAKAITDHPQAITIKKDRAWFSGEYKGTDVSITIDSVKFDHSPAMRYFIEAEIGVSEKNDVAKTKQFISDFLKELLGKAELIESPGMFTMAFKKK